MSLVARALRWYAGVLASLLVAVACSVLLAAPAHACSCVQSSLAEQVDRADQVFSGTVTGVQVPGRPNGQVQMEVAVERALKGDVDATVTVVTAGSSATCGLPPVPEGTEHLFLTSSAGPGGRLPSGAVWTSSCSGSRPARAAVLQRVESLVGGDASQSPEDDGTDDPGGADIGTDSPDSPDDQPDESRDEPTAGDDGPPVWPFVAGGLVIALGAAAWSRRRTR